MAVTQPGQIAAATYAAQDFMRQAQDFYNTGNGIAWGPIEQARNAAQATGNQAVINAVEAHVAQMQSGIAQTAGGGGGGGTPSQIGVPQPTRDMAKESVLAVIQAQATAWGLGALYPMIVDLVQQGYTGDAIAVMLRNTAEYKARFPAMAALTAKGRAITEGQYIEYERTAAQLAQRFGITESLVMGQVTTLLENEVSASELNDRITLAVADSYSAPQDLRDTISNFYGPNSTNPDQALRDYYLAPEESLPELERQSAASRIAVWAQRQRFGAGIERSVAERLQGLGVTEDQAESGFGRAALQQGLMSGQGDLVTEDQLVNANLASDANAIAAVQRAQTARVGRFEGGGQFDTNRQGAAGVGAATR